MKKYKALVKELVFVLTEYEYVCEVLKQAHIDFETYYQQFCTDKSVPLKDLNEKYSKKISKVFPKKEQTFDKEGIIKQPDSAKTDKKVIRPLVKMYKKVASKIHPDKFCNRERTSEVEEKIEMFKEATSSYNSKNWGKFLDICEKLDILPTRYEEVSTLIRKEISATNKNIVENKKTYSWKLYDCDEDEECKQKIIKEFLFHLFKYQVREVE